VLPLTIGAPGSEYEVASVPTGKRALALVAVTPRALRSLCLLPPPGLLARRGHPSCLLAHATAAHATLGRLGNRVRPTAMSIASKGSPGDATHPGGHQARRVDARRPPRPIAHRGWGGKTCQDRRRAGPPQPVKSLSLTGLRSRSIGAFARRGCRPATARRREP